MTVRTVGHAIGGNSKRTGIGTTEIKDHGPDEHDTPFAVRAAALVASPLWHHYQRAARRSIHHDRELLAPFAVRAHTRT